MEVVNMPEPDNRPILEIPSGERLGTLVKRYRVNAKKTISEVAAHMEVAPNVIENVEMFRAPMSADQLQEMALFLGVRFEPFLDASRDFHRAIWQKQNAGDGLQLAEMSSKVGSVGENVVDLEQASVDLIWEAARTTALLREMAATLLVEPAERDKAIAKAILAKGDDLLGQAKRLQDVLVARGVLQEAPAGTTLGDAEAAKPRPQGVAEAPDELTAEDFVDEEAVT